MRKWIIVVAAVLLCGWALHTAVYGWIVPKTAWLALPGKWRRIPLRQPIQTVHDYLGLPAGTGEQPEHWVAGTRKRAYHLRIYYAADTTVTAYSIRYHYINWLVNREYLIDSASIR